VEQRITIELLGETFQFKVNEGDLNPREIADHLAAEVEVAARQFPAHVLKTNKLAVVMSAALNITKQLFEAKDNHREFLADVSHRTFLLDDLLNKSIEFDYSTGV
jgi:cell division protein ZapA (FtsZ GTPase activity inhibitor)